MNSETKTTAKAEDRSLPQPKLLVVDDEPAITKLLKVLLTKSGYQVSTCNSAEDALRALSQTSFDLIVTDAMMPTMDGFELARAIRRNPTLQNLPILMLTRKNDRTDVKKALEAGVSDYVIKPIDESLLVDKVQVSLKKNDRLHVLREVAIHGSESHADARIEVRIISMKESGMIARFPIEITGETRFELDTPIFKQIGIALPFLRLTTCRNKPAKEVQSLADFPFEAEFTFVGLSETELKKIRSWLQKQEILRKK